MKYNYEMILHYNSSCMMNKLVLWCFVNKCQYCLVYYDILDMIDYCLKEITLI